MPRRCNKGLQSRSRRNDNMSYDHQKRNYYRYNVMINRLNYEGTESKSRQQNQSLVSNSGARYASVHFDSTFEDARREHSKTNESINYTETSTERLKNLILNKQGHQHTDEQVSLSLSKLRIYEGS